MPQKATQPTNQVESGYDAVAEEYVRRIYDELAHKPLDRQLLDRFAQRVGSAGIACDVGCGPGQVARYLTDRRLRVCGVDLSPKMLLHARHLNPDIQFTQGNMLALDAADGAWAGIAAFYCICNLPPGDLPTAFQEMHRVLAPGGPLLLSFHLGDEVKHLDEWWGLAVSLDFYSYNSAQIAALLTDAGFTIEEIIERDPYPDVEHQSRRAYLLCRA